MQQRRGLEGRSIYLLVFGWQASSPTTIENVCIGELPIAHYGLIGIALLITTYSGRR